MRKLGLASCFAATTALAGMAVAQEEPIKIGVLATLEGTYSVLGEDGERGFELAVDEWGGEVAGHPIEHLVASTDTTPDTAVRQARKLVEQDGVDIIVGPLSGSEGIALRDYAKTVPEVTIVNGISGAQETTMQDPAENFGCDSILVQPPTRRRRAGREGGRGWRDRTSDGVDGLCTQAGGAG